MDYRSRKTSNPRLPGNPEETFKDFPGWIAFLGKELRVPYATLGEAQQAVKRLGIRISAEYFQRYKEDSRLHASPSKYYRKQWRGWVNFFGRVGFYSTIAEASKVAKRLKMKDSIDYKKRYKEDPKLPSEPSSAYKRGWKSGGWNWPKFLGND